MKNESRGFTVIELTVVLSIIAVLFAVFFPIIEEPIFNAKVEGAVTQAQEVVSACDILRKKPISSVRDPLSQEVRHTYTPDITTWTDAKVIQDRLSSDYRVPLKSPFDTPYLFKLKPYTCFVAIELDREIEGWDGHEIESANGVSLIIVSQSSRRTSSPNWVRSQNMFLHEGTQR